MNIAIEFIKYSFRAKRRHGVHSPYVYRLQDESFKNDFSATFLKSFKSFEKALTKNSELIAVNPFGAGSKKGKKKQLPLNKLANRARTSSKYGKLIFQLGEHIGAQHVLELGTHLGIGTAYLSQISTLKSLTSVEGCANLHRKAHDHLTQLGIQDKCTLVRNTFEAFIEQDNTVYDLIFIDGDHRSEALFEILEGLQKNIHNETLLVIDDIRWSKDMFKAWQELIAKNDYHLSMDFFRMGVLAVRKNQEKEHFILKKK
ncbi:Methyltransferase domain-containing protein [Lishizhenia tianjinensis]|uniref:Methyltransferase domain-containing protein n=1 Tax=Lishizhenia tianjinensis TaxID=477690 RepID=A0A1I7APS3_9FLAO|nr:class I SAM-dependent methyltransferase [Lishizhenia tianjinensis]SFT76948.1 Methyltransferase domain-containing protein [Lishizhenia tianjinensis]